MRPRDATSRCHLEMRPGDATWRCHLEMSPRVAGGARVEFRQAAAGGGRRGEGLRARGEQHPLLRVDDQDRAGEDAAHAGRARRQVQEADAGRQRGRFVPRALFRKDQAAGGALQGAARAPEADQGAPRAQRQAGDAAPHHSRTAFTRRSPIATDSSNHRNRSPQSMGPTRSRC